MRSFMMELSLVALGLSLLFASAQSKAVGFCSSINAITRDDTSCSVFWICSSRGWSARNCPPGTLYNPAILRCAPSSTYTCPYTSRPGGCTTTSCKNGGECIPTRDTRGKCRCKPGFYGTSCEHKVKPARVSTSCSDITCENGGRCYQDTPTSARCYCPSGFMGPLCGETVTSGGVCPVPKEETCDPECQNDGRCFKDGGEPKCFCAEGYGGEHCETVLDPCSIITCQNSGRCVVSGGVASCQCPDTYNGDRCQNKVTAECSKLKCENNAPCKTVGRSTQCDCLDGFTGDRCQYVDACPKITCLNSGVCQTGSKGEATCKCAVGYTGSFCEIALDCEGFTCFNGGKCKIEDNERVCECPDRTEGDLCEKKLQCSGDGKAPCKNGGQCYNSEDGFMCACPIGRKGLFCEEFRSCSDNVVCENGGTCEDTKDEGAKCKCEKGFQGPRCETPEDDCGGCQNGGICELPSLLDPDLPKTSKLCACPANFAGKHCETETECTIPCPVKTGSSGERYHVFVYPDVVNKDWVYLCRGGRLTHLHYCEDGSWYDPFAFSCHNKKSFAAARLTAGNALYPTAIPT